MAFFADSVGTALVDVDALPWIPFLPYSDQIFLKLIKVNPVNGEWTTLLKLPAGTELPKHHHAGTVHVYTVAGRWRYKEHDWVAGPGAWFLKPPLRRTRLLPSRKRKSSRSILLSATGTCWMRMTTSWLLKTGGRC